MRILFVLGGLRIGGYEILSVQIANELAVRGNTVAILSLSADSHIIERVNTNVEVFSINRYFKYDLSFPFRVSKLIKRFNPDAVLCCAFLPYLMVRFASILVSRRISFFLAFHVTEPFNCRDDRWNYIFAALSRPFKDKYIAIHSSQVDFYCTRYGLQRQRFSIIHNGVDVQYFSPADIKNHHKILRICHVASLKPLKDQWTLLKAMEELDKSFKTWELRIIGADEANVLASYIKFAQVHKIASKIRFLGAVDDIRRLLWDSDIFVLTSVTEACPMSLIEALAVGLPCVATDVGGIRDIVEDGKEGFLVQVGDYRQIAKYIAFLAFELERRKQMSLAARAKALAHFTFRGMIEKYCHLLNGSLQL